ncbi:MAG: hypothetical protein IPK80_16095 [Nannocystis sp.]|nr:hypothetical protein [Nannocystis sp.]
MSAPKPSPPSNNTPIANARATCAPIAPGSATSPSSIFLQKPALGASWQVVISADSLPEGACFNLATWQSPPLTAGQDSQLEAQTRSAPDRSDLNIVIRPKRAFLADAGPSYFGDATPETAPIKNNGPLCGWNTPLRLSLGTFPWVYGHRLQSPAPALAWKSNAAHQPAHRALQIASGFWQAEGNLRQDARDVVAHWKHWRSAIAGPLADNQSPALRLEKQLLRVQGDEHTSASTAPAASSAPPPLTTSSAASPPSSR